MTVAAIPATTTWTVDASHTNAEFAVKHLMISTVRGRFADVSGTVTTAGEDLATARVDVSLAVASIDTRNEQRDGHLKSADFFNAEQYPTITFRSNRVERVSGESFRLVGDLTIRGVTREVALDVTAEGSTRDPWGGERLGFSAVARVNRKDFGLEWNMALETGGVVVGDEVRLSLDVELVKQAA